MAWPAIDHSLLSPSGKMSKRGRAAALAREAARLFPPGYWDEPEPTAEAIRQADILRLRRHAATLRELAQRGMSVRKHTRAAEALEREAAALEATP